ncbi:MAG: helix-turn-helix domain-containing protein [Hyphomonadaceae bacterium]|nr:helix-turn-helix domain-containing protein [Hyphomonadaceae bacterium]
MSTGRPNQKRRTRKDLLDAAARLMKQGRRPSLEEIAEEAMVSRATAYRYFPSVEALLVEVPLDLAAIGADELFEGVSTSDPLARVARVDDMFDTMMSANEAQLRLMLASSLERSVRGEQDETLPMRQNRRSPLIEAALAPARAEFKPADYAKLSKALAFFIGTEGLVVAKDVLQLDDAETRKVKRWAIAALIEAAKR